MEIPSLPLVINNPFTLYIYTNEINRRRIDSIVSSELGERTVIYYGLINFNDLNKLLSFQNA